MPPKPAAKAAAAKSTAKNDTKHNDREIEYSNQVEAVMHKSMWLGSKEAVRTESKLLHAGALDSQKALISAACVKVFDEVIVNAIDHYTASANAPREKGGPVTEIRVDIDDEGTLTVYNNGPGIKIVNDPKYGWSVQNVILRTHTGSNLKEDPYRLVGGTNGLGLKLVAICSKSITVETLDKVSGKLYKQTFYGPRHDIVQKDPEVTCDKPQIHNSTSSSYTRITYKPNYDLLCQVGATPDGKSRRWMSRDNLQSLIGIIGLRMAQVSAFITDQPYVFDGKTRITLNPCSIWFCGKQVKYNVSTLGRLYNPVPMHHSIVLRGEEIDYPLQLDISLADKGNAENVITLINGVYVKACSYSAWILKKLCSDVAIMAKADPKTAGPQLAKMLHAIVIRYVPNPQFGGQTKEQLTVPMKCSKGHDFPETYVKLIWKLLQDRFKELDLDKAEQKQDDEMRKIKPRDHQPAELYRNPGNRELGLALVEGKAALLTIQTILQLMNYRVDHGTNCLRGVPPNTLKEIRRKFGENKYEMSEMLKKNIPLQGLLPICGLEYGVDYSIKANWKRLKYKYIIVCTDQDWDGIGQICGLVLIFILVFWPQLIQRGFMRRYATPILRVYRAGKKKDVLDFYTNEDFENWKHNMKSSDKVKYYKGLAGHNDEETKHMAHHFLSNIYTYTLDSAARDAANIMYGTDSNLRKTELRNPTRYEYDDQLLRKRQIRISEHFMIATKEFQMEVIARKLANIYDGMIPVQRKAFASMRKHTGDAKVYQHTGRVTVEMYYQHGDSSMNGCIIKMAQTFNGSNVLPKCVPIGQFGTLKWGRGVAGSPRYIGTKYNKLFDLICPRRDDVLLEYEEQEGAYAEPISYCPIVPLAVMETITTAAVGWKIDVYSRDWRTVLVALRTKIRTESADAFIIVNRSPSEYFNAVQYSDCEMSCAKTELRDDTLYVTGLPGKMWSGYVAANLLEEDLDDAERAAKEEYLKQSAAGKMKKAKSNTDYEAIAAEHQTSETTKIRQQKKIPFHETIEEVIDNTSLNEVNMRIKFKPGAIDRIMNSTDENNNYIFGLYPGVNVLEEYCGLYARMHSNLNLIDDTGIVNELPNYSTICELWYARRLSLYIQSYDRERILLEMRCKYYSELLRYIDGSQSGTINISRDYDEHERTEILRQHKFTAFHRVLLFHPGRIPTAELQQKIMADAAIYKYVKSKSTKNAANPDDTADPTVEKQNMENEKICYKYIDAITVAMGSKKGIASLQNLLDKTTRQLSEWLKLTPKKIWLRELDELEAMILYGQSTGWMYDQSGHNFING